MPEEKLRFGVKTVRIVETYGNFQATLEDPVSALPTYSKSDALQDLGVYLQELGRLMIEEAKKLRSKGQ